MGLELRMSDIDDRAKELDSGVKADETIETECPKCGHVFQRKYEPQVNAVCPKCAAEFCGEPTEVYSRVVGYYRPVKNWHLGKQEEFKDRLNYHLIPED